MHYPGSHTPGPNAGLDLQHATGISSGDPIGVRRGQCVQLGLQNLLGHFSLQEIVRTRCATTALSVGVSHQFQAGDRAQETPGRGRNSLGVNEMTGIVVADPSRQGS
jgi:hypothetical protein